jgi:asparagine synthase (glutamine-hydrolysing)
MLDRFGALFGLPSGLRQLASSAFLKVTPHAWEELFGLLQIPIGLRASLNGINLQKFARALGATDVQERYNHLTTFGSSSVVLDPEVAEAGADIPTPLDAVGKIIYRDMAGYLTGDILVKLDRATMGASLEGRCPFLDDRIVEFAWRLPTAAKIRKGRGKWPLRRLLGRYLPESLFERPKQGFNVPIGEWLRGPLRGWAQELLDGSRIRRDGLLHSGRIQSCWQQHLNGQTDRSGELWAILMVQAWLDTTRNSKSSRPVCRADEVNVNPETSGVAQIESSRAMARSSCIKSAVVVPAIKPGPHWFGGRDQVLPSLRQNSGLPSIKEPRGSQ